MVMHYNEGDIESFHINESERKYINLSERKTVDVLIKSGKPIEKNIPWSIICGLLTIEKYSDDYKSCLIDIKGRSWISHKTTKQLLNELFEQLGMSYQEFVTITDTNHYKVPYIYKHYIIVPDSGVSKQSSNWWFLNHLQFHEKNHLKNITIYFLYWRIDSKITEQQFERQLHFIFDIYGEQLNELRSWHITDNVRNRYIYKIASDEFQRKQRFSKRLLNKWTKY